MPSYQDIEQRLRRVEDKLDFTMKTFKMARKEGIIEPKVVVMNLLQVYNAMKQVGGELLESADPTKVQILDEPTAQS